MPVTAQDIVQDDDVRAVLEERTQEQYQFRRAYRDHDATGINSGSFTFPEATDNLRGAMNEVAEESDYPRTTLNYDGIQANYTKDGFIVDVTDEAVDDSAFDVIMDVMEEMAVGAEKRLDSLAWTGLNNNNNSAGPIGTNSTDLNYNAVVDAYTTLFDDEFVPTDFELYVSADGFGDLAKDDNFTHATDQGDQVVVQGELQMGFGVPVVPTNTGDLGADEAIMVDTGRYGYESTRWDREVDSEYDFDNDTTKYKIRHRKDFVVMKADGALMIQGGV